MPKSSSSRRTPVKTKKEVNASFAGAPRVVKSGNDILQLLSSVNPGMILTGAIFHWQDLNGHVLSAAMSFDAGSGAATSFPPSPELKYVKRSNIANDSIGAQLQKAKWWSHWAHTPSGP